MAPPISISVRTGDHLQSFRVEDGKVATMANARFTGGKYNCTCSAFKTGLSATCSHIRVLKFYKNQKTSEEKVITPTAAFQQASGWNDHSNIHVTRGSHRGTLSPEFPETSVFGLVTFLLTNSQTEQMRSTVKKLDASQLLKELLELYRTQKPIMTFTTKAYAKAPKIVAESPVKVEPPIWETIEPPEDFYVERPVWNQMVYSTLTGKNVLLIGPSGSGKSELVYALAARCGAALEAFNFGAMSEARSSLIGLSQYDPSKGTWFQPSRFVKAVSSENLTIVLLDELTRADRAAFNIILPLLDRQGYLALDEAESGQVVRKGSKVCFMSTANVGMEYTGTDAMDKALKDRHSCVIEMDFPPPDEEIKILQKRSKIDSKGAELLVKIASTQRRRAKTGEFLESISTRMLIATAEQVGENFPIKQAVQFCITNHFSKEGDDASDRSSIGKIVQSVLG